MAQSEVLHLSQHIAVSSPAATAKGVTVVASFCGEKGEKAHEGETRFFMTT